MQKNRCIDVLKGILILFVVTTHCPIIITPPYQYYIMFTSTVTIPCFMMISGYVLTLSFQKSKIENMEQAYESRRIIIKLLRFLLPYTISFLAGWILYRILGIYQIGIREYGIIAFAMDFLGGGSGQGSYYIPFVIQLIFVFPVIYFIVKKHRFRGLVYVFLINAAYEVIKVAYGMGGVLYRLLVLRYLFIIAAGCYLALEGIPKSKKGLFTILGSIVTGLGFVYVFLFTDYSPKVIIYWPQTSFLICLVIAPVLGWVIEKGRFRFKPLELLGRASFNIYLVQMIYYNITDYVFPHISGPYAQLGVSTLICVIIGVIFYYLEQPLTGFIIGKIKRSK